MCGLNLQLDLTETEVTPNNLTRQILLTAEYVSRPYRPLAVAPRSNVKKKTIERREEKPEEKKEREDIQNVE